MTPSLAPTPVATAIAVGAARPRAQGHAATFYKNETLERIAHKHTERWKRGRITIRDTANSEAATGCGKVESTIFTTPALNKISHTKNVARLRARMVATNLLAILSVIF